MRFLLYMVILMLTACEDASLKTERDYSGVFDGLNLSNEAAESVKQADQVLFQETQSHFIGLTDNSIYLRYEGFFSEQIRKEPYSSNTYMIRRFIFFPVPYPAGEAKDDGLIIVGLEQGEPLRRAEMVSRFFPDVSSDEGEQYQDFQLNDGRCRLARWSKNNVIIRTVAVVQSGPVFDQKPFADGTPNGPDATQNEIDAVYCINMAHLFHVGFSNLSKIQREDVVLVANGKYPVFPLRLKDIVNGVFFNGIQVSVPRKEFLRTFAVFISSQPKES